MGRYLAQMSERKRGEIGAAAERKRERELRAAKTKIKDINYA